ncbi:MAG TPA: response regulator [Candidatus Saccharimonadia bacterium]|jgi:DNA-binding response OmpR family regulator
MSKSKPKILIVDDDEVLADLYRMRLEMEGFEISVVSDGEHALEGILEFKPDLVLLDLMLPKMSGFDVLKLIRRTPATSKIRVLVFSALGDLDDRKRAAIFGADDYEVKSEISLADMVAKLRELLTLPQAKETREG